MNELTLPSTHKIRSSGTGGLRLSTLPLGHGECLFGDWMPEPDTSPRSVQAGSFNHRTGAAAF